MIGLDLRKIVLTACLGIFASTIAVANSHTITIASPKPPVTEGFKMGESRSPDGTTLTLDSNSLLLDGKPWTPVMGEFHFARYPTNEWREELFKMKAGGIDIVSTYVFWIHHEESEGQFDWSGSRNLRAVHSNLPGSRLESVCALRSVGSWRSAKRRLPGLASEKRLEAAFK